MAGELEVVILGRQAHDQQHFTAHARAPARTLARTILAARGQLDRVAAADDIARLPELGAPRRASTPALYERSQRRDVVCVGIALTGSNA